VDDELRKAFDNVLGELSKLDRSQRATTTAVSDLAESHARLERYVYGGSTPPPGAASIPDALEAAGADATETSLEVASFKGQVIGALAAIRRELAPQSQALGIGVHGLRWLRTREGRTVAAAFAALLFALASLVGGARMLLLAPVAHSPAPALSGRIQPP
jgi:hypothetical protein